MALLYAEESYAIRGALFEVHKRMGPGFLEKVYQESLEKEFLLRGIPYKREVRLLLDYKGQPLHQTYIADFICYDKIIVECKAVSQLTNTHKAQLIKLSESFKSPSGVSCQLLRYVHQPYTPHQFPLGP